jgi:mannosyl-oligosaccharide alpha-1,2-mannosidase
MYTNSIDSALEHRLLRDITVVPGRKDLMVLGMIDNGHWSADLEHLTCFAGGMLALGGKLLNRKKDFDAGTKVK